MRKTDPNLIQKATNFTSAAIKHVSNGLERLNEQDYQNRLVVCIGNELQPACELFNAEKSVCRDWKCGCSIKKKAYWRSEDCPQGKWPDLSIKQDNSLEN